MKTEKQYLLFFTLNYFIQQLSSTVFTSIFTYWFGLFAAPLTKFLRDDNFVQAKIYSGFFLENDKK